MLIVCRLAAAHALACDDLWLPTASKEIGGEENARKYWMVQRMNRNFQWDKYLYTVVR